VREGRCKEQAPELRPAGDDHWVSCWVAQRSA
jgi:hypothetical protein